MTEDRRRLRKAITVEIEGPTLDYIIYDDGVLSVKGIDFKKSPDEMYSYSLDLFNRSWLYQLRDLTFSSEVMDGRIREQKIVQWLKRRGKKFLLLIGNGGPIKFMSINYKKHNLLIDFFKWLGKNFKYIPKLLSYLINGKGCLNVIHQEIIWKEQRSWIQGESG